jgi:hypothetical protein
MTCLRFSALALVALLTACLGGGDDPVEPDRDQTPPTTMASPDAAAVRQSTIRVTLSTSEPATTYYTLDGSAPTTSSTRYAAPIAIDRPRTLRFFSVDASGNAEAPLSLRYRIDTVRRLLLDVAAN